jgi:Rrf2 family protein
MKLTAHEEYGLRCLLQVARQGETGSATIPEISRNEGISPPYAAKLLRMLRRGGFVKAARGKVGGYTLATSPVEIFVGDVLALLGGRIYEEDFCRRHAGKKPDCVHSAECSMRSLWHSVQEAIDRVLGSITLHDLLCPSEVRLPSGELQRAFTVLNDDHAAAAPACKCALTSSRLT